MAFKLAQGLLAALALSAAGSVSSPALADVIPALRDAVPEAYRDGITVAVFNDWPPDEFVQDGELVGWSVDIAHEMEERLGVPFTYEPTSFDAIIPGLMSKRFDAGFSSFGVTEERLATLDFVPQRLIGTAFGLPADSDAQIAQEADACGMGVAVQNGSWDHQLLEQINADVCAAQGLDPIDIQPHPDAAQAELAVRSGRAQATVASSAKMAYLAQTTGELRVSELVLDPVLSCIGLRKGDPLGPVMAAAIQSMIDDGTYQEIMAKWGMADSGMITESVLINEANKSVALGE